MLFNCNSIALLAVGLCLPCIASLRITMVKDVLYDVRVSNHGARLRIMIKEKGLSDTIEIKVRRQFRSNEDRSYLYK